MTAIEEVNYRMEGKDRRGSRYGMKWERGEGSDRAQRRERVERREGEEVDKV